MTNQNQKIISWQAPEFRHYEKNIGWYTTLIAIAILIVGFFIIQQDYFAAITMAVIAVIIVYFSRQSPKEVGVELGHSSVKFGNIMFPYKQLKSFWVVNNHNHLTLNFETTTYINNLLVIELGDQDPNEIRNFLLNYLSEHPERVSETFTQKVMHKLKF